MNLNNLKRICKDNRFMAVTIILAAVLLAFWGGSVTIYKLYTDRHEVVPSVQTAELQREATLEKIQYPVNLVEYFIEAVETEDLDMALRSCPIDEIGLNLDTERLIENQGEFYETGIPAPSKRYNAYFPLASAELTAEYTHDISAFMESWQKYQNKQVKRIDFIYPDRQLQSENVLRYQTICDTISADAVCEMAVIFEAQGEQYVAGFTLAKYFGGWKLLTPASELAGTTEEAFVRKVTLEESQEFCDGRNIQKLEKELTDTEDEEEIEESQDSEEITAMIENGEALLPENYFVINSAYGATPQELIENVTRYIEKGDTQALMNYFSTDTTAEGDTVTVEKLQQQGSVAENIQRFYFRLLSGGEKQQGTLEELGKTANEILNEQNPDKMFYLDLMKVIYDNTDNSCRSFFWYGGDIFEVEFFLQKAGEGWQVQNIENVKKISQKEYDSME